MRGIGLLLVILVVGFVFLGSVVQGPGGFAIYLKREASLDYIVSDVGATDNLERLILTLNQRYRLLVIGYNDRQGLRLFESMPALP